MMSGVMDLLVELAATGRIGAVRTGMSLDEAQTLLGPGRPHPALRMRPDLDGYPYSWGGLELEKAGDAVARVGVQLWPGGRLELPAELGDGASATVERQAFLSALDDAGCRYEPCSPLTFGNQSAIRTEAGTTAAFGHFSGRPKRSATATTS